MEDIDLRELLDDIWYLLRKPGQPELVLQLDIDHVFTSRIALKQILLNFINNSIKYLDRPGGRIEVSASESGNFYYFSVSDNGSGIPKGSLNDIFDLFKAIKLRKNSGTGVGLSIVRKLAHKLGGEVTVHSNPEQGTKFEFSLKK